MTAFGRCQRRRSDEVRCVRKVQKPLRSRRWRSRSRRRWRCAGCSTDRLPRQPGDIYEFDASSDVGGASRACSAWSARGHEQHHVLVPSRPAPQGADRRRVTKHSHRSARSFIKVNCAALQETSSNLSCSATKRALSRRRQAAHRPLRAGRRRHSLDETGTEPETQAKIRACCRTRVRRLGGTRTIRGRAPHRRDQPRPFDDGRQRQFRGISTTAQSRHLEMPALRERKEDIPRSGQLLHPPLLGR